MLSTMQASIDAVRVDRETAITQLRGDLQERDVKQDERATRIEKDAQRSHEELSKALELQDRRTSQIIDHLNSHHQQQQHRLLPSSAHAHHPQLMAPSHPYPYSAPTLPPSYYAPQPASRGMVAHLMVDGQPTQMLQGWPLR
jgi:hypothetical protein